MPLPVPCNSLIANLLLYSNNNPPYLPTVRTDRLIEPYVVQLAVDLANEATSKAQINPARTLAFNLLSLNNWNNGYYGEVLQLAVDMLRLDIFKGMISNPGQGIIKAAETSLVFWTSRIVYEYPEVRGFISPEVLQVIDFNLSSLTNITQEIQAMHQRNNTGGDPRSMPCDNRNNGNQNWPQQQQSSLAVPSNLHGNTFMSNSNRGTHESTVTNTGDRNSSFGRFDNSEDPYYKERVQQHDSFIPAGEVVCKELTSRDWKPSINQPYRTMADARYYQKTYNSTEEQVSGNQIVIEYIVEKDTIVDRNKHRLSIVAGAVVNTPVRHETFRKNVYDLREVTSDIIEDNLQPMEIAQYVNTTIRAETYLDPAIYNIKTDHLKHKSLVYRGFAIVANPIPTDKDYWYVIEELSTAKSFVELARKIKALTMAHTQVHASDNEDGSDINADNSIFFFNRINRVLTHVINSFLANNLSISTVSIDDFSVDVLGLFDYLTTKFSVQYARCFELFEKEFCVSLFNVETLNADSLLRMDGDNDEKEVSNLEVIRMNLNNADTILDKVSFIPVAYSITDVALLTKELNITVEDIALLIREQINPELFSIAKSVFDQVSALGVFTVYNILTTVDGDKFKLYKGYLGVDAYLISKF